MIEVPPAVSESLPDSPAERIMLGHITGVSGLQGWVKVHSDTSPRNNIVAYRSWWLEQSGQWSEVKVLGGRPQGKTIVAHIEGVTSPEQAGVLIGARIAVKRSDLPVLGSGEYYWADLIGMQVKTIEGNFIGPVNRLFETGANDVVVIDDHRELNSSAKEVLVPWLVPDVITDVDMKNRTITIDWDPDF
ncbi:MAG: ribosome maturation factor RimM [Granulosicoccus sp.]